MSSLPGEHHGLCCSCAPLLVPSPDEDTKTCPVHGGQSGSLGLVVSDDVSDRSGVSSIASEEGECVHLGVSDEPSSSDDGGNVPDGAGSDQSTAAAAARASECRLLLADRYYLTPKPRLGGIVGSLGDALFYRVFGRIASDGEQKVVGDLLRVTFTKKPLLKGYLMVLALYGGLVPPKQYDLLAEQLPTKKQFYRFLGPYASQTAFENDDAEYLYNAMQHILTAIEKFE